MLAALDWVRSEFVRLVASGQTYVFLLPIYAVLLVGERALHEATQRGKRRWDDRDGAANLVITVVDLGRDAAFGHLLPLGLHALLYTHARLATLPSGPLGWLLAFVLYDLCWYTDHRIAHRTGLFWAFHSVHHSSREFNFTVASRGFWLDAVLTRPLFYGLALVGVSPFQLIAVTIVTNVFGIVQHTRLIGRLGPLDALLATPSNHRVHHGSDAEYLDRNYGELLIVWDRLLGTYTPEAHEPRYGLRGGDHVGDNPLWIEAAGIAWLARKMRSARTLGDALACLWRPPEWLPPGAALDERR